MTRATPPGDFTKRKIARIAEQALRDAGVAGVFPTPIEVVQSQLGVRQRIPMAMLPDAVAAKKPLWIKRALGAYVRSERTVFIDTDQVEARVLFTDAHEAIHAACEWHEDALRWDGDEELFRRRREEVEGEANFGAGHLIFQGGRFHRIALEDAVTLATPLALAPRFGASRAAAAHFYVEEHPDAVALLVLGRYVRLSTGAFPVWRSVQSQRFRQKYGDFGRRFPDGVKAHDGPNAPFAEILSGCRVAVDPTRCRVDLLDLAGRVRPFVAEAFFNQHVQLLLVTERQRVPVGRKVRLAG